MIFENCDYLPEFQKNWQSYILFGLPIPRMAEAAMSAFGAAVGVSIALAVVTFALRGKGHSEPLD